MAESFDEYLIDLPSESKSAAGRYDKLQEAGMATRVRQGHIGKPERTPQGTAD